MTPITDHDRDTLAALVAMLPKRDQERWAAILAGLLQRIDAGFTLADWRQRVARAVEPQGDTPDLPALLRQQAGL